MRSILLVQFRTDISALQEKKCFLRYFQRSKNWKLKTVNAFDEKIDFSCFQKIIGKSQAVILGGSGQFYFSGNKGEKEQIFQEMLKRITPFLKYLLKNDFPVLGICFGHQILGHFLGVEIVNDKAQAETGSFSIFLTKQGRSSPLFKDLPQRFICQFGHQDSLKTLPKNTTLLAISKRCKVGSFQYKKNIYGVQFHPELNFNDMAFRIKLYYCPKDFKKVKKTLKPSPYAFKIIKNFLKLCNKNTMKMPR